METDSGFHIELTKNEEGNMAVLHFSKENKNDEINENLLYSSIENECDGKEITCLDISILGTLDQLNYNRLSAMLKKIIFKETCKMVKVSESQVCIIRGCLKGLIYQEFKQEFGEAINLKSIGNTINVKDILSSDIFLNKIVSDTIPNHIMETINLLQGVEKLHSVPPVLIGAVVHAYKYFRKQKKAINVDKKFADQCSFQTAEECFHEILNDVTKETECDKVDSNKVVTVASDCAISDIQKDATVAFNLSNKTKMKFDQRKGTVKKKTFKCYVCKKLYCFPKKRCKLEGAWNQYPRMCLPCAEFNFVKRNQRANLDGKYAIVTGGRIKIGYELVLKLLRDGCFVIVTSRFPHDATKRFAGEKDFCEWNHKLKVYPLDLKDINGIKKFVNYVKATVPYLDIIINNAAQTLRRPLDFYRHLLDYECIPQNHLKEEQQQLLATTKSLSYGYPKQRSMQAIKGTSAVSKPIVQEIDDDNNSDEVENVIVTDSRQQVSCEMTNDMQAGISQEYEPQVKKAKLEQDFSSSSSDNQMKFLQRSFSMDSASTSEDNRRKIRNTLDVNPSVTSMSYNPGGKRSSNNVFSMAQYFPRGVFDGDGQQLDIRRNNSWRTLIDQVPLQELMELLMVNTVAPFMLNKDLKSLMLKSPSKRKFIVNVSAMEGQFNRATKTKFHPHTNMAKAALNMMTRTAALGYQEKNIYMTSVDTGWVTDERPLFMAKREQKIKGFKLPLDCVDGAARIYDPVVMGLTKEEVPHYAVFLKDYKVFPW